MPTYAYACTSCDNRFDVQQSFSDEALTTCPSCEGRLRKLFSSVGVVFKGSGFYRTDSRAGDKRSSGASSARTEAGAATPTSDGSTGGTAGTGTKTTTGSTPSSGSSPSATTSAGAGASGGGSSPAAAPTAGR